MTRREAKRILLRAAKLVDRGWCQNAPALNAAGESVNPLYVGARAWCLTGAVERAYVEHHHEPLLTESSVRTPERFRRGDDVLARIGPLVAPVFLRRGLPTSAAVEWNNDPDRTAPEVAALLREMASAQTTRAARNRR